MYFGHYEQDYGSLDGKEDIEWTVLERKGNSVLLISTYILAKKRYYPLNKKTVTWRDCSLRKWLNENFYQKAFDESERGKIIETELNNTDEKNTRDSVFLLSEDEVEKYMKSEGDRKACYYNGFGFVTWGWLLRGERTFERWDTTGNYAYNASMVNYYGEAMSYGDAKGKKGVRPALWLQVGE
ncbi:MAG: DUF6273 domain-containing protein [Roseburia sp.]|nr:DUF6273 domain-containing protein [Roseburia sp.]